eukprot:764415-Hanusia_phi.AAC.2
MKTHRRARTAQDPIRSLGGQVQGEEDRSLRSLGELVTHPSTRDSLQAELLIYPYPTIHLDYTVAYGP